MGGPEKEWRRPAKEPSTLLFVRDHHPQIFPVVVVLPVVAHPIVVAIVAVIAAIAAAAAVVTHHTPSLSP